jgi:hypothetical protein
VGRSLRRAPPAGACGSRLSADRRPGSAGMSGADSASLHSPPASRQGGKSAAMVLRWCTVRCCGVIPEIERVLPPVGGSQKIGRAGSF